MENPVTPAGSPANQRRLQTQKGNATLKENEGASKTERLNEMRKTKIPVFVLLASLLIAPLAFAAQKVDVLFTSTPAKQDKLLKLTGSLCHTCEGRYPVVW